MNMKTVKKSELILNIGLVILTVIGVILMFNGKPGEGVLQASGLANFKYYTVLTNVFCGLIALIYMICLLTGKGTEKMIALKLGAVCGVAITFAVVAFMFGPLYGFPQFYKGGNFIFHLIEPLAAMVEFIVVRRKRMPFVYTVIAAVPTFIKHGVSITPSTVSNVADFALSILLTILYILIKKADQMSASYNLFLLLCGITFYFIFRSCIFKIKP